MNERDLLEKIKDTFGEKSPEAVLLNYILGKAERFQNENKELKNILMEFSNER